MFIYINSYWLNLLYRWAPYPQNHYPQIGAPIYLLLFFSSLRNLAGGSRREPNAYYRVPSYPQFQLSTGDLSPVDTRAHLYDRFQ